MIPTFPVKCLASETTQLSLSLCCSGAWLLAGPSPGVVFLLPGQLCVAREPGGITGVTDCIGDGRRSEGVDCRRQTRKKQRSGGALLIDNSLPTWPGWLCSSVDMKKGYISIHRKFIKIMWPCSSHTDEIWYSKSSITVYLQIVWS